MTIRPDAHGHGPHCEVFAHRGDDGLFYTAKWQGTPLRRSFATEAEARETLAGLDRVKAGFAALNNPGAAPVSNPEILEVRCQSRQAEAAYFERDRLAPINKGQGGVYIVTLNDAVKGLKYPKVYMSPEDVRRLRLWLDALPPVMGGASPEGAE